MVSGSRSCYRDGSLPPSDGAGQPSARFSDATCNVKRNLVARRFCYKSAREILVLLCDRSVCTRESKETVALSRLCDLAKLPRSAGASDLSICCDLMDTSDPCPGPRPPCLSVCL